MAVMLLSAVGAWSAIPFCFEDVDLNFAEKVFGEVFSSKFC